MIKNIEKDISVISKDFNNLKSKLSTRKNIRKMRAQNEIKAKLSELIKESVIIEKELEDYRTECEENGLISLYSKYEGISKITVDFSESLEETLDLHNFIKNYNIFSVTEGNMSITGTKNIIIYIETGFTVLFDKNGVILKFEQPNMAKPEPIEKYFDRIEEIKKRLF